MSVFVTTTIIFYFISLPSASAECAKTARNLVAPTFLSAPFSADSFISFAEDFVKGFELTLENSEKYKLLEQEANSLASTLRQQRSAENRPPAENVQNLESRLKANREELSKLVENLRKAYVAEKSPMWNHHVLGLRTHFFSLPENEQEAILRALNLGVNSELGSLFMPEIMMMANSVYRAREGLNIRNQGLWDAYERKTYSTILFIEVAISEIIGLDLDRSFRVRMAPTGSLEEHEYRWIRRD